MAIYQVTIFQRWLDQECRNIYYVETPTTDPAEAENAVTSIYSSYLVLADSLVDTYTLYGATYRRVDVAGLPALNRSGLTVKNGLITADSVATQIAAVVHFRASTAKPNRSTKWIPGLPETAVVDSRLTNAYVATLEVFCDNIIGNLASLPVPVDLLAARWNSTNTVIALSNTITSSSVATIPGTQRRRKIGRGS